MIIKQENKDQSFRATLHIIPNSFVVCFGKPYVNRHKLKSYPVKAVSFKEKLSIDFSDLYKSSKLNKQNLILIFVFYNFKSFNSENKNDFEGNMFYIDFSCIYFNIREFAR